ncbi:MAG: type VI secretion system protein TssA [Candidatus Nealsonbacteria bacterium]|nr:type VI secretion system protein TssA [Candidatus Nealsonbacteria bacterium]
MASSETFDFEQLLAPIAGENPAGENLREDPAYDSLYNQIAAARNRAGEAERDALRDGKGPDLLRNDPKDWQPILELGCEAISHRSKDLKVAAFLIEALVRVHGFAGLRDGFRLVRKLAEDFWDGLYPRPDEDGVITRMAPLTALNGEDGPGTLIRPITKVALTQGRVYGPFSLLHHRTAAQSTGGDGLAEQDDAVTLETFDAAVRETPPEWFAELHGDLAQCLDEFKALGDALEEKCGEDDSGESLAPPSSNIRKALKECREMLNEIAPPSESESDAAEADPGETGLPVTTTPGQVPGQLQTRQEAFRMLQRAADFFRRTEPHSPVSYALEQAVRWGEMPLPKLLTELIPDESALERIFKVVGIQPPKEEQEEY